jgi:hypothetical protein
MNKYILIKPQENCGLCGHIWQTIRAMYHNPNQKYYVDFGNCIYKSYDNENLWDSFFYQPHTDTKPSSDEIEKQVGIIFDAESDFVWRDIKPNTPEEIQRRRDIFADIISKYFKLKPEVQEKIDNFVKSNFEGKRVLGVHFRGTDHPLKKRMCDYMQVVKNNLVNYDKLFVCSDEYERFRLAEVTFSDKIVAYDSIRSKNTSIPLHCSSEDRRYVRDNSVQYQHKIAEDVIVEAYLMSKVDALLCCAGSNVNYFARAINPKLQALEIN